MAAAQANPSPVDDGWVSASVAVKETGVSRPTLIRWATTKQIRGRRNAAGEWELFLPDALARANGDATDQDIDDDMPVTPTAIHSQLVVAIKASQRHVEMLLEPARKYLEGIGAENDRLRARASELETKLQASVDKWEAALSLEHERRMEEAREQRTAARDEKLIKSLIDYLPAVVMGMAGHFGMQGAQEAVLVRMVAGLSDEQIGKLVASGAFGPRELAVLDRLRATYQAQSAKGTNGKQQEQSTGSGGA